MNDCPRVEFRDLLPEFVHERLEVHERALVLAHVEGCADCRAELELLRSVRVVLAMTPRVDVVRIVASLPAPQTAAMSRTPARWHLNAWRLAAAAVIVLVGGASLATYSRHGTSTSAVPSTSSTAPVSGIASAAVGMDTTRQTVSEVGERELAVGGGLGDLSTGELTRLLSDIDHLEPLPQAEPDLGAASTEAPGDSS